MRSARGIAHARVGLLGNPSDGYGGKAIAFSLANFRARVSASSAERFELRPGATDLVAFPSLREAVRRFGDEGCDDGLRLLRAAVHRFAQHVGALEAIPPDDDRLRFALQYETDVPRQVGLAGSSAIVIATLRALCDWFEKQVAPATLAELALAAELEDLGIAAGAMDRVVQSYQGLLVMDLREPRSEASYRPLDPALLPPLVVAFDPKGGEPSGRAHGELRARWLRGDPDVLRAVDELRDLVDEGVACIEGRDAEGLRGLLARNFAGRCRIFAVSERDRAMAAVSQKLGGAAKLCGSGGAVVAMPSEPDALPALEDAYRAAGFVVLRPRIAEAEAGEAA